MDSTDEKKTPEKVVDVNIQLAHGKFKMEDAFELRAKAIEIGKTSEVLWNDLTPEHREVMTQIFKRSLEVLHANSDRFLPNIITGDPMDHIAISCQILFASIEEQVDIRQESNEFDRQAAKEQMIAELIEDWSPLDDNEFIEYVKSYLEHGTSVPNSAVDRLLQIVSETQG
jgi:hypothetical protein